MQLSDIRSEIYTHLPHDIKDILKTCSIDKLSQSICSNRSFWIDIFMEQHLPLPEINPDSPASWAILFEKERIISLNIQRFKNLMKNQVVILDAFDGSFFDILNVDSINTQALLTLNNLAIFRKLKKIAKYGSNYAELYINNTQPTITLYNNHIEINNDPISMEELEMILHRALSLGIELQNINGIKFKYVG